MSRRSKRLAGKANTRDEGEGQERRGKGTREGKRMSIGDAMGLKTPAKPQATNLRQAKAMETTLAAAAKIVSNNAKKSKCRVRTPKMPNSHDAWTKFIRCGRTLL